MPRHHLDALEARINRNNGQTDIYWLGAQLENEEAIRQEMSEFPEVPALDHTAPEAGDDYQEISAGETIEFN